MTKENNKMQVDIENLFKQNVNDLSSIKELYRKLKEIEDRISQIKYIDTTLTKKLQKDYEKLKKQITDENFQLQINSKIDNVKSELKAELNAFDLQLSKTAKPLKGKKIAFLGDSLIWGLNGAVAWKQVEKPISVLVEELTGATCINHGVSGSTLGGDGSTSDKTKGHILGYNPMNLRIKNIDNVDAIFCMGGTYDYATDRKVPVGKMEDTNNLTFYGGLDTIIKHIGNEKPRIKLITGTPPRRAEEKANMYGNTLSDYVNAVKEKCKYYGINYVDLYNKGNCLYWSSKWRGIYSPDGVHGTQELYNNYAILIANELIKIL